MPHPCRRHFRSLVLWSVAAFFALQFVFILVMDRSRPELYDREYGTRLRLLQACRAQHPDDPLLAVIGSSRIGLGFTPGQMPELRADDGRRVLAFNFSHLAAGARTNLMQLHRLLREDLKPTWAVIELVPGGLFHEASPGSLAAASDLPVLMRHSSPPRLLAEYCRSRLNVFYKHRQGVLQLYAPAFANRCADSDTVSLQDLGDDDGWMRQENLDAAKRERLTAQVRQIYCDRLQHFRVDPALDRATRELLALGRDENITMILLLSPENTLFRSWYSVETRRQIEAYLADLRRAYGVAVVDARDWVEDVGFSDPHHLKLHGAHVFTERLRREVLLPLVSGYPVPDFPAPDRKESLVQTALDAAN